MSILDFPREQAAADHVNDARQVLHLLLEQLRSGEIALELDDLESLVAIEKHLGAAAAQLAGEADALKIARDRIADAETERRLLIDELRETQNAVEGVSASDVHLRVDWKAGGYVVERQYTRRYLHTPKWSEALSLTAELRAIDAVLHVPPAPSRDRDIPHAAIGAGAAS